jgi:hypothetical protein
MKILIPSSAFPTQKNKLIQYVYNIKNAVEDNNIQLIWIICQPNKFCDTEFEDDLVIDIHQFTNAIEVIEKIKPDCVLTNNNSREPITMSFIMAAKKKKIPLIYYYLNDQAPKLGVGAYKSQKENLTIKFRSIVADKTPMDSNEKKKLRRALFFMYKNKFLMKTRHKSGINWILTLKDFFDDIASYVNYKKPIWNKLADLNLCSNQELFEFWISIGIDKKKIVMTGSPFWDKIYEKIRVLKNQKKQSDDKIRVLVVTSGLVEHGIWTEKEREFYLNKLFQNLNKDNKIIYSIKIHPASEDKIFYQKFLTEKKINSTIYQHEDLFETMKEFDIIISYGFSSVHTECAYGGIKMILLDINWNYKKFNLVDEAIRSGYFIHCKKFEELLPKINELYKKEVNLSEEIIQARDKMSYKFDGKSGERAINAIINLVKNQKK